MAVCSSLSLFPPIPSQPKTFSSSQTPLTKCHGIFTNTNTPPRFLLKAGFNEIEPDLNEDQRDVYATNGIDVVYTLNNSSAFFSLFLPFCFHHHFHFFHANFRISLSMEFMMATTLTMKENRKLSVFHSCSLSCFNFLFTFFHRYYSFQENVFLTP